jgi:hypothetical protein
MSARRISRFVLGLFMAAGISSLSHINPSSRAPGVWREGTSVLMICLKCPKTDKSTAVLKVSGRRRYFECTARGHKSKIDTVPIVCPTEKCGKPATLDYDEQNGLKIKCLSNVVHLSDLPNGPASPQ